MSTSTPDALVIGAGAAGLACARALLAAGRSVLVLEAGARIGGRIRSHTGAAGGTWELGAQVVHDRDNEVWQKFLATATLQPFGESEFRCLLGGRSVPLFALARLGTPPWAVVPALAAGTAAGSPLPALAAIPAPARGPATSWLAQDFAADPADLDVPELLALATAPGAVGEEGLVTGGFGQLVAGWAHGVDIRLNSPVRRLTPAGAGVIAQTDGGVIRAGAAVVTAPPWTCGPGGLQLDGLPAAHRQAAAALRGGDAVAAVLWCSVPAASTASVFDADTGAGFLRTQRGYHEVGIVAKGPAAQRLRVLLSESATPSAGVALRRLLTAALPITAGAAWSVHAVADWGADPFIRGAYTSPTLGRARHSAAWATPWGDRIFFAGESTSGARGCGRVHGALATGLRAAGELLARVPGALPQAVPA